MARRLTSLFLLAVGASAAGCAGKSSEENARPVTLPLPTPAIAGREVARQRADSVLAEFLLERAPEIDWVLPAALRNAAARAPGVLTDPDRMGTALLRAPGIEQIPDPLRSQMRNLIGVAADRYALVPAAVSFVPTPEGRGSAEITFSLADARFGIITWYTVAIGEGDTPWVAMWNALRPLVPDLP